MREAGTKRILLVGQLPGGPAATARAETSNPSSPRVYLLSPAHAGGRRAKMLLSPEANFELAHRLRDGGIPLHQAFSFMSPLYFRGKLLYASTFANPPSGIPGGLIITPCRGLLPFDTTVHLRDLAEIAEERVAVDNPRYRDPLERDLGLLSSTIGSQARVVLLGSIATRKYIPLLHEKLGERLMVPRAFVGLGNMSRGALLLRCSQEKSELEYITTTEIL
jgi:hypothetical protein